MIGIYIFLGILILLAILFIVWTTKKILSPQLKMQKAVSGERTKFKVDTSQYGNEYYKNKIEEWLKYNKFSKYKKNKKGRYLTYHQKELIYKFGFNYYEKENSIIIEAWVNIFGNEHPLKTTLYKFGKDDVDILNVVTGGPENEEIPIDVYYQAKEAYLIFLESIMNLPEGNIEDENIITLKDSIDYTKIEDQRKATMYNLKFILIMIAGPTLLVLVISLLAGA